MCTAQHPTFNYPGERRRRFCGQHKLPDMVNLQPSAAARRATTAVARAGKRPFPTLGKVGSLARLWTLYSEGDKDQMAWAVREQGGKAWRSDSESRWSDVMALIDTIRKRAKTHGLSELAAAERMDAEERVGLAKSMSRFLQKLKAER